MGLLSKILGRLGVDNKDDTSSRQDDRFSGVQSSSSSATTRPSAPSATMSEVDVVSELERRAQARSEPLNWRTSIVDLLKLLDIDSSLQSRKELADELGAPKDLKDGSAEMNMWLHRTVMTRVARNGGNVPRDLTD